MLAFGGALETARATSGSEWEIGFWVMGLVERGQDLTGENRGNGEGKFIFLPLETAISCNFLRFGARPRIESG